MLNKREFELLCQYRTNILTALKQQEELATSKQQYFEAGIWTSAIITTSTIPLLGWHFDSNANIQPDNDYSIYNKEAFRKEAPVEKRTIWQLFLEFAKKPVTLVNKVCTSIVCWLSSKFRPIKQTPTTLSDREESN